MELKTIQSHIYEIKGRKIMLDFDLAYLYEVQTKVLNQAVKRNIKRFPEDFMFQLTEREWEKLNSKADIKSTNRSQIVTSSQKHRPKATLPYAFTEQGVAMLSGVLHSDRAVNVNIAIMRAFVFIRQYALSHEDLTQKLKALETKYDKQFNDVYDAINFLLQKEDIASKQKSRKQIGFTSK
ncbi:MAG: ORF6N domain-containing protein [Saprospiraceae bacterium]|uniref:ORF6N domain-containing protein n=1 Tax=Candidatus Opimibacter skivensis TaxID=2982028 RepID=A0A9D7STX0_9BACT|nr:ORF6N domain-containing protein [Candidatus Opimibacter skivensis]